MNKNWIVIPLLILLLCGIGFYVLSLGPRDIVIKRWVYEKYLSDDYQENWLNHYPETLGMNYTQLLGWLDTKLRYPQNATDQSIVETLRGQRFQEGILFNPVAILEGKKGLKFPGSKTLGRCEEFSLSFLQSLFVNNYRSNLLLGDHFLDSGALGTHVWVELNISNKLVIIDPTDACTWRSNNLNKSWNECPDIGSNPRLVQNVTWNSVWRITEETEVNVTEEYNQCQSL